MSIKLKAEPHVGFNGAHVRVAKMTPYLGHGPEKLYPAAEGHTGQPVYPVFVTYFTI